MDSAEKKFHFPAHGGTDTFRSLAAVGPVIGLFPLRLAFNAWLSFWLEARDNAISSIRCLKG